MFRKARKRVLTFVLAFALMLAGLPWAVPVSAQVYSGEAGDDITWMLDTGTGVLTLSGTGDMWNWDWGDTSPWNDHMENITSVVISDGITTIGDHAFDGASSLTSATIRSRDVGFGWNVFEAAHPDFTIYAFADSTAHDYAIANGHRFVPLDDNPSGWAVAQVSAALEAGLVPPSLQQRYTQPITRAEFAALAVALYENQRGEITGREYSYVNRAAVPMDECDGS